MECLQFLHLALEVKLFWTLLKLFHLAFMGPKEIFLVLLVFVKDVNLCLDSFCFACGGSVVPVPFFEETVFLHCIAFAPLSKIGKPRNRHP